MSEKYHYESGAIHHDHHKEINIGSVSERSLRSIISAFLNDDAEEAVVVDDGDQPTQKRELTAERRSILKQIDLLIAKGDWKLPATEQNMKQSMRQVLGVGERGLTVTEMELSDTLWSLLEHRRGGLVIGTSTDCFISIRGRPRSASCFSVLQTDTAILTKGVLERVGCWVSLNRSFRCSTAICPMMCNLR